MNDAERLRGLACAGVLAAVAGGCSAPPDPGYQGYAEGEFVLIASPYAGRLDVLHVARGTQVEAGAPLFELDQVAERAAQREAREQVRRAQAQTDNLSAASRPQEREAALAAVEEARSALELSQRDLKRTEQLFAQGFVAHSRLDAARSTHERNRAELDRVHAQAALAAESVGRSQEVAAARAQIEANRAMLAQRDWSVEQKAPRAPVSGLVFDTFFVQGEWVPAGRAVVSLLPPGNIKLRFYVPETQVGGIRVGQRIAVTCDGCGAAVPAAVSYVSVNPEYTPPLIYSRQERAKLVFLVEARPEPDAATRLKPGQPVDVQVLP
jgi:HlyD family secretion protein